MVNAKDFVKKGLNLIGLGFLLDGAFKNRGKLLVDLLKNFRKLVKNPPRYITAIMIAGVLFVVNTISTGLSAALSVFEAPAGPINSALTGAGRIIGNAIIGTVGTVNQTAINIALGAGPLAPIGVFALWLAEMWLAYQLLLWIVPVGAGVVRGLLGGGS